MKIKNSRGFTLIELLGAVVILGVISSIAIVSYTGYINSAKKTAYDTAEKSMKEAAEGMFTDCLIDQQASMLCSSYSAPDSDKSKRVILRDLINADYLNRIKDPEVKGGVCNEDKSYVFVYGNEPLAGTDNKNLTYKSCLLCSKYQSENCDFELIPDKDFGINIDLRFDSEGGITYNGEWTNHNVWMKITSGDPYKFGIKRIELARNALGPWNEISSTVVWNEAGSNKIYIRAIDNANNISGVVPLTIKIDVSAPLIDVTPSTVNIQEGINYDVWTGVSYSDPESGIKAGSTETNIFSTLDLKPGTYTITYTVKNNVDLSKSATRTLIVKPNTIVKYRTRGYTGWGSLTTTACIPGELCQTGTLYSTRSWNPYCTQVADYGWVPGNPLGWITCDGYPRCEPTGYWICSVEGVFYEGTCDRYASLCKNKACGSYEYHNRYIWGVVGNHWQGCYSAWSGWSPSACAPSDSCQTTTGYQTRNWQAWSGWTTNVCTPSSLCEKATCGGDSPGNSCTPVE